MNRTTALFAAAIVGLGCTGPVDAHHTGSMYATAPVWAQGSVVGFQRIDPHTIITLEERTEDGQLRRWVVEGPGRSQLNRLGLDRDVPPIGDVIAFCAFPYNDSFSDRFPSQDSDGAPSRRVAGHVMVKADGQRRLWEPHGIISQCILSTPDQRPAWLEFLNSNPRAREALCEQRARPSLRVAESLQAAIEALNRELAAPCE